MESLLKATVICFKVFGAAIVAIGFIMVADEVMTPSSAAVLSVLLGCASLAFSIRYVYRLKKMEGFKLNTLPARRKGSRLLFSGLIGLALVLAGGAWLLAPELSERQLEKSSMPIAALITALFWLSLIFTLFGLAVFLYSQGVCRLRTRDFRSAAGAFAGATFFLALSTLFCAIFLGVIDENFFSLPERAQYTIPALFALMAVAIGIFSGMKSNPEERLSGKIGRKTKKRNAGGTGDKVRSGTVKKTITLFIISAAILTGACVSAQLSRDLEARQPVVTAEELQTGAKRILGKLGLPLGEVASVKARFVLSEKKEAERALEVMEVAGRALPRPVRLEFSLWQWGNVQGKELPLNKPVRLRAYETGGMVGIPLQAMKETVFVETVDWQFRTSLVVLFEEDEKNRER